MAAKFLYLIVRNTFGSVPAVFAVEGAGLGGQVATPALVLPQPAASVPSAKSSW